ncbi:hypothetical protein HPG69_009865, partial [Diceros bicornis minor]
IEDVVEGIPEQLNSPLEPSTKEETLRAMCSLAGNNTHIVVPMLLNKLLPWDRHLAPSERPQSTSCRCSQASWKSEAIQAFFPQLLLAVLCHLYWMIEQNVPPKVVVYSKEGAWERDQVRISATSALGHMLIEFTNSSLDPPSEKRSTLSQSCCCSAFRTTASRWS